jgi:hypothetical protein
MKKQKKTTPDQKRCFVIMPISTPQSYDDEHFLRVYKHLIKPACEKADLKTTRADEVQNTNYIVIDILKRIINSDIVICDLSSKNPNVLYELGIRQAFNLPSVLIKDKQTERIFDIQGLRTYEYDEALRVDTVNEDIEELTSIIEKTIINEDNDINSLIQLLEVQQATISTDTKISEETGLILKSIRDVSQRLTSLEEKTKKIQRIPIWGEKQSQQDLFKDLFSTTSGSLPNGQSVAQGEQLYNKSGGEPIGYYQANLEEGIVISTNKHGSDDAFLITPEDPIYKTMTTIPF